MNAQAKKIYTSTRNKLGITRLATDTDPLRIEAATWVPTAIRNIGKLEIWIWLGPVGGEVPTISNNLIGQENG